MNDYDTSDPEKNRRDAVAYPGGYEVEFKRSIKGGRKMHTVQVRYGKETVGASGENLADTFRALADRLEDKIGGAPYASVVWGSPRGELNDG